MLSDIMSENRNKISTDIAIHHTAVLRERLYPLLIVSSGAYAIFLSVGYKVIFF